MATGPPVHDLPIDRVASDGRPRRFAVAISVLAVLGLIALLVGGPDGRPVADRAADEETAEDEVGSVRPTAPTLPPVRLLADGPDLVGSITLIRPLATVGARETRFELIDAATARRQISRPLFFTEPTIGWPGQPISPFVAAGDDIVYASGGRVYAAGRADDDLGPAIFVLPSPDRDHVWSVASGARSVTQIDVESGRRNGPYPLEGEGFPLAALTNGLVLATNGDTAPGTPAFWSPSTGVVPLPVPDGMALLGTAGDLLVVGDEEGLAVMGATDGTSTEVRWDQALQVRRTALSPDGSFLALAQRESPLSLSRVVVVETATGDTVATLDGVFELNLTWSTADTLVAVRPGPDDYRVVEFDPRSGATVDIAVTAHPFVFVVPGAIGG